MIRSSTKNIILTSLRILYPKLGNRASILMYHSVATNNAFFTVSPEAFEKQLDYLHNQNFSVIKLSELVRKIKNRESIDTSVVITFDDAYTDNYKIAFPILKKYNMPASIFVPTGLIGKTLTTSDNIELSVLSEEKIQEFSKSDLIEFFPHTHTHINLKIATKEKVREEIQTSTEIIEKITGHIANIFAYPKGKYSQDVIEILKEQKHVAAVTVEEGLVYPDDNAFTLKRNSIDSGTTFLQFKAKVSGAIELYRKLKG